MSPTHSPRQPPWLYPNLLGLDAPAVAVAWQWLFAKSFGISIPSVFHLILGLSAWCIYLADRLYDARTGKNPECGTARLKFTLHHFPTLIAILLTATLLNLFLIIRHVPTHLILSGLATASLLAIYYAYRFKNTPRIKAIIPREILCGMLFSLGCAITPHAFGAGAEHPLAFWFSITSFGILCSAACILISIWERDQDLATHDTSIATEHTHLSRHLRLALPLLAILALLYTAAALKGNPQIHTSLATSFAALLLLLIFQEKLSKTLLRTLADAVLLTPLIFIWL